MLFVQNEFDFTEQRACFLCEGFFFFIKKEKKGLDSILFCDILVSVNLEFRNSRNQVGQ